MLVIHAFHHLQAKTEGLSAVGYRDVKCKNLEKRFPFPGPYRFQGLFCSTGITMQSCLLKKKAYRRGQAFEIEIKPFTGGKKKKKRKIKWREGQCQLAVCPPARLLA